MQNDIQKIVSKMTLVSVFAAAEEVALDDYIDSEYVPMSQSGKDEWIECRTVELVRALRATINYDEEDYSEKVVEFESAESARTATELMNRGSKTFVATYARQYDENLQVHHNVFMTKR